MAALALEGMGHAYRQKLDFTKTVSSFEQSLALPTTMPRDLPALHQHIGMGGHGQVEAEELVLRIQRHRGRGAEAEEVDLPGLDQQIDGAADQVRVQRLQGTVQRGDGAAENLLGIGFGIVISLDRTADIGRAAGQALGQLKLELGVTADAERTAETVDRRFTDRSGLGEGCDGEAGRLLRVEQDDLGDFFLSLVQFFEAVPDLFQKISHAVHSVFPSGDDANKGRQPIDEWLFAVAYPTEGS